MTDSPLLYKVVIFNKHFYRIFKNIFKKVKIEFQTIESPSRGYTGLNLELEECQSHLIHEVKNNLLDREEWNNTLESLRTLRAETGFDVSAELLADIQSFSEEKIETQQFRIGEAFAEVILEQEFSCRFHWNENRDARNPKGNKTGADLVGFIEVNGQVLFLFGEVKTSSETANRPPQVMTTRYKSIESQLRSLHDDIRKRRILISYLQNKARHYPSGHAFFEDFEAGKRAYYSGECRFHLFGVLIRDVSPDERDVSVSYNRLRTQILEPKGLKLLALYLPIQKKDWLTIINEEQK